MTKWEENTIRMYEGQDFESLRLESHRTQQLFEDPLFPASIQSLSNNYEQLIPNWKDILWKRPREIVSNPQLIVNGIKRTDPTQGDLGNCWFIAAMSALTQNNLVLQRVIPLDQSFQSNWYAGIFHFRFWRYQQWYDVVIDDRLPYLNSEQRLWSARNTSEINEFWVPLLEKAYAKLNGSYSNLGGGLPVNALTDFTGGIEQRFELKSTHLNFDDLFEFICSCIDYGSLIACSINSHDKPKEMIQSNGLVIGHTYSITNYHLLAKRGILRLRNPWGNEIEWNGQWADNDPIWNLLDERTRQRLSIRNENDGEFWMSFDDFYREFDVMEVCHISPDTYDEFGLTLGNVRYHWRMWYAFGSWRSGINSGGSCATRSCRHGCYYWRNPQFTIELTLNRSFNSNRLCMMIIALMQKPLSNANEQYIQIRLFRIKPHVKISEKKIYKSDEVERIASTGPYVNRREVSLLLKTTSGTYLIIPSLADVNQNCDFLLRIFSQDTTMGRTFLKILASILIYLTQIFLILIVSKSRRECLGFVPTNNEIECRSTDIKLYTWSGPGYELGECWYHGHRFNHGETWGRIDQPGSPYCLCEQGQIRIFYNQIYSADSLTFIRSNNSLDLPTSNDLSKWPIFPYPIVRQRIVICSTNRLGLRIRSKDRCFTCRCSTNGHWLCRKAIQQTKQSYFNQSTNTYHINLFIQIQRHQSILKFCILIERLSTSNFSRYIEIPRETSWIDRHACTRCSCLLNGQLKCQSLEKRSCSRPCLLTKTQPIPMMYYFSSDAHWLPPMNGNCRSCTCTNGTRQCSNCFQTIQIDVSPFESKIIKKVTPCLLQTTSYSHRLIYPGQRTWFEQRCYFCSLNGDRLIQC